MMLAEAQPTPQSRRLLQYFTVRRHFFLEIRFSQHSMAKVDY